MNEQVKRRPGRPKKEGPKDLNREGQINIRLDAAFRAWLDKTASERGMTASSYTRYLLLKERERLEALEVAKAQVASNRG